MADQSGSRERQRLFIGGLHESVSEEEISKRFNVYGNVISVQKVTRPPSDVFPGAGHASGSWLASQWHMPHANTHAAEDRSSGLRALYIAVLNLCVCVRVV